MKILFALLFLTAPLTAEFGYISYSTSNIGDDIQTVAVRQFLPGEGVPVDREYIGVFQNDTPLPTVVNGWFMHTKEIAWYLDPSLAPEKSWPPSDDLDPLLISIHFWPEFSEAALSIEGVEYLKAHSPVGARDLTTLEAMQNKGIPSYFAGCMTLTLENPYSDDDREDIIYVVDQDQEILDFVKAHTSSRVEVLDHGVPPHLYFDNDGRLAYAESILEKYRKAKMVITGRLHATLPCVAFGTPVLRISSGGPRVNGLDHIFHHCSRDEFFSRETNFDNPEPNPNTHFPIRKNLIEIITNWVSEKS